MDNKYLPSYAMNNLGISLHDYQRYSHDFILKNPYCGLFLTMGAGKTLTTLTALYDLNPQGNVLIIAPLNIARSTWLDEIKKWKFPFKTKSLLVDEKGKKLSKEKRLKAYKDAVSNTQKGDYYVYFINRDLIVDLIENVPYWVFPNVIIDESQSFKSHDSKRFRSLKKVRPYIERMVLLTGTPAPNGIMDLWAQIYLLDQGERLGPNITTYRNRYFRPGVYVNNYPVNWMPLEGSEETIYNSIADIVISIKNTNLKMPPLTMNTINVYMDTKEKALYEKMKKESVLTINGEDIIAVNGAVLQGKLSQMASGALYTDDNHNFKVIHKAKLECCEYIINNTPTPLLIAYHFKSDKMMLMEYLTEKGINAEVFDGSPNMISRWNKRQIPVMLIQPASAGHGLNLQDGGSTLIWYTIPWSLESYLQTNARLYRQGQNEPTFIHHILTDQTIDSRILQAINNKDLSQNALLEAVKAQF